MAGGQKVREQNRTEMEGEKEEEEEEMTEMKEEEEEEMTEALVKLTVVRF